MIELKNISKKYGNKIALNEISIQFKQGMYGLLGPNGAGKTTLMRIIASVMEPDSGQIYIDDQPISLGKMRQQIGYLPQHFSFYGNLTVEESLQHIAYLKNISKQHIADEVESAISEVNLADKAKSRVSSLSGGMLRRLGIAQAIIGSPRMLIVDEPTAGLDPEERVRFRNLLSEICENRTVLISTHIVEDIEFTCNEIIFLDNGNIIKTGSYENILHELTGKIWEIQTDKLLKNRDEFMVLSKTKDANGFVYKALSDSQPDNSASVNPSLEDAYLYFVGALNDEK